MEMISRSALAPLLLAGILALSTAAHAQGVTDMKKGEGGSAAQGSAGPSGAVGAASDLERCDKPMGARALSKSGELRQGSNMGGGQMATVGCSPSAGSEVRSAGTAIPTRAR